MSRESQASGGCVYSAPSLRATSFLFFLLSSFFFAFSAGPGNQIHRRRHAGGCPAKKGPPRRRWRGGSAYVLPRPRTIETSPFRSPCFFFLRRSIFSRLSSRRAESAPPTPPGCYACITSADCTQRVHPFQRPVRGSAAPLRSRSRSRSRLPRFLSGLREYPARVQSCSPVF